MSKIKNYLGRNFKKERGKDLLNRSERSKVMAKVKSRGTKFENDFITVFKNRFQGEFETNVKDILGKPDIVIRSKMICIFLDSDFWHGWYFPKWKHLLKDDFWRNKIIRNRRRDKTVTMKLRKQGWIVLRIWEHNIREDMVKVIKKLASVIE